MLGEYVGSEDVCDVLLAVEDLDPSVRHRAGHDLDLGRRRVRTMTRGRIDPMFRVSAVAARIHAIASLA